MLERVNALMLEFLNALMLERVIALMLECLNALIIPAFLHSHSLTDYFLALAAGCSGMGWTMDFSTVTTTPLAISTSIVCSATSWTLP